MQMSVLVARRALVRAPPQLFETPASGRRRLPLRRTATGEVRATSKLDVSGWRVGRSTVRWTPKHQRRRRSARLSDSRGASVVPTLKPLPGA